MVTVRSETRGPRSNNGCNDTAEGTEPTFDLADIVQDRTSNLFPARRRSYSDESLSDERAVSAILVIKLHPQGAFSWKEMFINPCLVLGRRRRRRQ
jgi:hypothetical protein